MKKFIIFILTIILLSLIAGTSCLFYGPCNTKIKEIVPEKYHKYLNKFEFNNSQKNSGDKETIKMDLTKKDDLTKADIDDNSKNDNGTINNEIIEEQEKNNGETGTGEEKSQAKKENLDGEKNSLETKNSGTGEIQENKNKETHPLSETSLEKGRNIEKEKNSGTQVENSEEKINEENNNSGKDENISNKDSKEDEIARKKREEYKQKLLERINKDKPKQKELVKTKNITIEKNGKKEVVKAAKFLGNSMYFTQDKENTYLYLKDKLLYTIKNSTDFFDKKTIDQNPDLITDGPVIRAQILKSFSLKKLGENVFLLTEKKWETNKLYLIDTKNKKFIPLKRDFSNDIQKAQIAKKGVVFLVNKKFYEGGVYYINRNTKIVLPIFKNSDSSISKDNFSYKKANSFKIVENNVGNPIVEINVEGPRGAEIIRHIEF